jgi:O-antigen ligase
MIVTLRRRIPVKKLQTWAVIAGVLLGAVVLGYKASIVWLGLLVVGTGAVVLLQQPILGLFGLVAATLVVPLEFGTGTAVDLNPVTLLVPALLGLWVLDMIRRGTLALAPSRTNRPLLLFLLAGLFSLIIGYVTWDPFVPRSNSFIIVQLAQWAVFAFSACAFWLTGNLVRDEIWLRRLTFFFFIIAGGFAFLRVMPGSTDLVSRLATGAPTRAPFWMLLAALSGGQLLFNRGLSAHWRLFFVASTVAVLVFSFFLERSTASYWIGAVTVAGVLAWLRWPRLRWPVVLLLLVLISSGLLTSTFYEFAGGDDEWQESGGSRLALIGRVIEVTMRNPITGLGPAAYRPYASMEPLFYEGAFYVAPQISSHNNYVDLFSHVGLLGTALFFWFSAEVIWLGFRLRGVYRQGFAASYVNAMLAAWVGALALMLFADWILPFVYNIGFFGFQASILVWLFLGGLVALEQMAHREP